MAQDQPKRQWKTGSEYEPGKRDGVAAVLTRAALDERYRGRLLSKDPQEVADAFKEEGNFEQLPDGIRIECFERGVGIDPAPTENTVMLVLPELGAKVKLPAGGEQYWQCTYLPYKPNVRR